MPVNAESGKNAALSAQQQFQTDQSFLWDQCASTADCQTMEPDSMVDLVDISLAMRQFYQTPVRSAA